MGKIRPIYPPSVLEALENLDPELGSLEASRALRRTLSPEAARQAAELHELRRRAAGKLEGAASLLLTRRGLEQASDRRVAAARAARMAEGAPGGRVWDATCGIGGDALALAAAGLSVLASDVDPTATALAARNLRRAGRGGWAARASLTAPPLRAGAVDFLCADPDRRAGRESGRVGSPEAWSPRLSEVLAAVRGFRGACVKLPPAFEPEVALGDLPHSWQWVSLAGELKEVALWTGALARPGSGREVLALDRDGGAARYAGEPVEVSHLAPAEAASVAWIAEPDPAVLRAGLVGRLARDHGVTPLGPGLAYLGGEARPTSPLLRAWRVLGSVAVDRRRVRALLGEHDVGPLTVKKRGHPDPAETLARRLRGPGRRRGVLLVARLEQGHRAYLVERPPR